MVDGKGQKLHVFVMVLRYSRKPFIMHTTRMDQATVPMGHVPAFTHFGVIPYEILHDNMRTTLYIFLHVSDNRVSKKIIVLFLKLKEEPFINIF